MSLTHLLPVLFLAGCASTPQEVFRNDPPRRALGFVVEVKAGRHLAFGAPVHGGRVLSADHVGGGSPTAEWKWRMQSGELRLLHRIQDRDLAVYLVDPSPFPALDYTPRSPLVGEEVYWTIHTRDENVSFARGWILSVSKRRITVDGWFHPGTSGSPVLRSDGTIVGIAVAGNNWSCSNWPGFVRMSLRNQLACLFRRSMFSPEMVVSPTVGGV